MLSLPGELVSARNSGEQRPTGPTNPPIDPAPVTRLGLASTLPLLRVWGGSHCSHSARWGLHRGVGNTELRTWGSGYRRTASDKPTEHGDRGRGSRKDTRCEQGVTEEMGVMGGCLSSCHCPYLPCSGGRCAMLWAYLGGTQ